MEKTYTVLLAIVSTIASVQIMRLPPLSFKPERPVTTTDLPRTVELPRATVTKNNGTRAELVTPAGDVYIIKSLPIGNYRDVSIVNRELKRAIPLVEEMCPVNQPSWTLPPSLYDQSNC